MQDTAYRALAIVGVGAILPDAPNAPAFWENVKKGRYSIGEVAPDRWDPALYYDPDRSVPDKAYSKIGGWVREFEWNPLKWRLAIPPRVVEAMDDAQKWAIACTREALNDYGYPARPLDLDRTAVILGNAMGGEHHYLTNLRIYFPEYARELSESPNFAALPEAMRRDITRELHQRIAKLLPEITEDTMPGELANCTAGRIANLFNFRGPNFTTDAACASAMAAFQAAMEGLVEHEFDQVVTGGVDRNMGASTFIKFCKIGALSATGTRPYAEGADGFIMGEGAAVFLLKRLSDAERDGDKIYAVVRGLGGSSDGKGKGITAPNPIGQKLCIERAWKSAGVSPATATMIEGHGTSTSVGDAVEAQSMVDVLNEFHLSSGSVALGSVKSNFGHLKGAAGAAGLLKATFALRDRVLPPSLHCERPNPNIDFAHSPLYVNTELRPWTATADGVRRAGASAFGFGGTNFHVVLEEYIPHRLNGNGKRSIAISNKPSVEPGNGGMSAKDVSTTSPDRSPLAGGMGARPVQVHEQIDHGSKAPLRGALVIGAGSEAGLVERFHAVQKTVEAGRVPPQSAPADSDLRAPERVVIDYADAADLAEKSSKALKALAANQTAVWKALRAQGIFRGQGPAPKVAFLYTGQGSQYANMLKALRAAEPIVAKTFAEADRVMTPLLGKRLSDFVFVDEGDANAIAKAEEDLRQTEITQPTVLAIDMAMTRLLAAYGIHPDMTMGHSLGEYGALVAAGALRFEEALEAVSARGRGMAEVAGQDNGRMAAVFAPLEEIEKILKAIDGYAVVANVNSKSQGVIGGASKAVEQAMEAFLRTGYNVVPLPVSHAFHTSIVAPASEPLRRVLERLHLESPRVPTVANVNGEFYPTGPDVVPQMVEILARQVASPVQFVKGLQTLYRAGARVFVEVGPKKALQGFAEDVLSEYGDAVSIFTNHPKVGDIVAFNQALCALYAAGLGRGTTEVARDSAGTMIGSISGLRRPAVPLGDPVTEVPRDRGGQINNASSTALPVTITGAALGLPGTEHIFDDANITRILRGEQFIDVIPTRFRRAMLDKHITRLVKSENGGPTFEPISTVADVIKLAGRGGAFDPEKEFGISADRLAALDRVTRLAIGVGLDALRDAGIPLVMRYKNTSKGTQLPDRWGLPDRLRDDTGIVFASIFPGYDSFAQELSHYYTDRARREQLTMLEGLRAQVAAANGNSGLGQEMDRRIDDLRSEIERDPFAFDRRFVFRILAMGHSQFAEFIGARGPNTQINSACASTTQAVTLAEDWIRAGRCRRVIVIAADDPTSDALMEWMGAGFLASGAAATDEVVEEAALPFDRRRHGMIVGMGAAAMVVESADAARERGIQPICEILSAVTANSAFHGTRLNVEHICQMMEELVAQAEARSGVPRHEMAPQMVFVSHETYTPARGGSASAEISALRHVFGDAADQIVITNTKGFTGHSMGVGIEDVVAVKALETGCVPPVANFKEMDPELGPLNLSKGGIYPVSYALRLGAGFGSQISMTLLHWTGTKSAVRPSPRSLGYAYRIIDPSAWNASLCQMAGGATADLEVAHRTLRVRDRGLAAHVAEAAQESGRAPALMPTPSAPPPKTASETILAPPVPPLGANSSRGGLQADAAFPTPSVASEVRGGSILAVAEPVQPKVETDPVKQKILTIVAEKTGYPIDMLDLDLDLEADLGVDTVKQAEVFATVRETYGIARDDKLKLRDFPTLAHVIRFVRERRPDFASVAPPPPTAEARDGSKPPISAPEPVAARIRASDGVKERVLALVVEKTGYPRDMLDLDLDLEADLGIDTVKQAEMFAAVRETYNIPRDENLKLRDFPTLARVIQFVFDERPDLAGAPTSSPSVTEQPQAAVTDGAAPTAADDQIKERVLEIVAEKTGYPKDMLDLDLDLEADLGIDTVKQAEMFASVRAEYHIPRDETMKLRDFPTLAHVIKFARDRREGLTAAPASDVGPGSGLATADLKADAASAPVPRPILASLDAANNTPRRVPVPNLRPPLAICKPTGVTLGRGMRVVIMPDKGGVGEELAVRLRTMGVEALRIEDAPDADALSDCLKNWLSTGPVQGVYWLPALDSEGSLVEMDLSAWREALRLRVKSLYATMRALYAQIAPPGTFLVSATRLGGQHGNDQGGATAPLGGAVVGFTKAYKRECMEALVKAVDFEPACAASEVAQALIDETLCDPGAMEIGYKDGQRWTVGLQEQPATDGEAGLALNKDTVFLITGAAGSIVSAITTDLAAASGGTFYLLDLVPEPDRNNPDQNRLVSDKEGLKRDLFARLQARGERATPALVEKELAALERSQAARSAIDAAEAAGGTAHYFSVDLKDADAVAKIIDQVRASSGRIDVLLHAAGMERSHVLPDKSPGEFDLVFDVKSDGWFNLLHAIGDMPLGTTVAFSSIAARFGNRGQTDYSAANDLLCKITSSFRTTRPATRAIAIDWTAWARIGMAARGSIPKMMEAAGIDMLPPEAGIPLIRRELTVGGARGEVVIGKRLGILMNELDSTGGLLTAGIVVNPQMGTTASDISEPGSDKLSFGPMIGKVTGMGVNHGLSIETTLDPKIQPFLYDHQIEGTPVLPGVMGIEAFAEAALWMLPGWHVEAIEKVDFLAPFKFYRKEPRTLTIQSVFYPHGDDITAHCRLIGSRPLPNQAEPQVTTHFTARVRLTKQPQPGGVAAPSPAIPNGSIMEASNIYRVYFHGPAYQVVERAWRDGNRIIGLMAENLPSNHHPPGLPTLVAPRLIELCFQTAGLWEMSVEGRMGLPQHVHQVCLCATGVPPVPEHGQDGHGTPAESRLYAVVTSHPDHGSFDAEVIDSTGKQYVRLSGYRTVALSGSVDLEPLKAMSAAA